MYNNPSRDSPPKNDKITQILKQAQQEDPTKLTFLDLPHDTDTYAVESSESGSFYRREQSNQE